MNADIGLPQVRQSLSDGLDALLVGYADGEEIEARGRFGSGGGGVETQGEVGTTAGVTQEEAHQLPLLDELNRELEAQSGLVPGPAIYRGRARAVSDGAHRLASGPARSGSSFLPSSQSNCLFAFILHRMTEVVKSEAPPARGHRQAARTQVLVVEAASRLFVDRGYTATTIEDIAAAADVGARTIYVRFGTKAALLKRVIDVAIVGDTDEVDVLGRDWLRPAMTAPTLDERIAALASANRQIMERTGALFAVAQQAAAVEPLIAQFWQQGRDQHQHAQRVIWNRMAEDSLLPALCDLEWLIDSASVLTAAETYLLITRMQGWSLAVYQAWLARTLAALPTAPVS